MFPILMSKRAWPSNLSNIFINTYIKATIAPTLNFLLTKLKATLICDTPALLKLLIAFWNIKCAPLHKLFTNFLFTYQVSILSTSSWKTKKTLYNNVFSLHLQNSPLGSFSTYPLYMPDRTYAQTFLFIILSTNRTMWKNVEEC